MTVLALAAVPALVVAQTAGTATPRLDGGGERNLLDSPAYDVYPIWSHDGAWVYFSSDREAPRGQLQLWRVPSQGGTPQRLSSGPWLHRQGYPSSDGKRVYLFTYQRVGGTDVGYVGSVEVPAP